MTEATTVMPAVKEREQTEAPAAPSTPDVAPAPPSKPGDTDEQPSSSRPDDSFTRRKVGSFVPTREDGVELLGEYEGSGFKQPRFLVARPDGQLVQLTDLLYQLLEQVDGKADLSLIAERLSDGYGRQVSPDNVRQLLEKSLIRDGLVARPDGRPAVLKKVDPLLQLKMRVTLLPEGPVNAVAGLLRHLFWPPVMSGVLIALGALDVWYFGSHGIAQSIRGSLYSPILILMIYGLMVLSVGWHELGHATACRYSGARPGKIGFGIYIIWPAFYTDVTDIYKVGKAGRVRTDLGGVYFNAIFACFVGLIYLLTHFEPILVLIMIQHALIFYQFMPFLRMDGYFVFADLTGVPDLFSRIKPILKSLVPGKKTPNEVSELKKWVRVMVTIWVIAVIPLLGYLFTQMVLAAPRVVATAWDSLLVQWGKIHSGMGEGHYADVAVSGIEAAMIVAPMAGMGTTAFRTSKRGVVGIGRLTRRRPVVGSLVIVATLATLAATAFILYPNGDYKPIQPGERWTAGEGLKALGDVTSGRPGLTQERVQQLGGVGTVNDHQVPVDPPIGGTSGPSDTTSGNSNAPGGVPATSPSPAASPIESSTPASEPTTEPTAAPTTPAPQPTSSP